MLVELTIRNLAIIEEIHFQADPGLTVLTGETGTGKSIIIDAIALVLGGRASADIVRTGCDEATVEAVFALDEATQTALNPLLTSWGYDEPTAELFLRREVSRTRRGACRVNGRALTVAALADIGRHLIDIHGQGDQLSLLQVRRHLDLLDKFTGLLEARAAVASLVFRLQAVQQELASLNRGAREMVQRQALLQYQVEEIASARLEVDEEETLRHERTLLANAAKRQEIAASAYALLLGSEGKQRGILDQLALLTQELAALGKLDSALAAETQLAESTSYQMEDLARTVRSYRDGVEHDPARLQAIEERLELIRMLKRKYGDSIADVLAYSQRAAQELATLTHSEERQNALQQEKAALLAQLAQAGRALSEARRNGAARLTSLVERELAELGMDKAHFMVEQKWHPTPDGVPIDGVCYGYDQTGLDELEFLIAPNPGEDPKPLVKSASGGETSRLMLALKTALSTVDPVPTLIFDEIDAGIGGRTGAVVGSKLQHLAQEHQVFCVTHLAQIAARAGTHLRVIKEIVGSRTISAVQMLDAEERVEELAVMIGGTATLSTRQSATELLRISQEILPSTSG